MIMQKTVKIALLGAGLAIALPRSASALTYGGVLDGMIDGAKIVVDKTFNHFDPTGIKTTKGLATVALTYGALKYFDLMNIGPKPKDPKAPTFKVTAAPGGPVIINGGVHLPLEIKKEDESKKPGVLEGTAKWINGTVIPTINEVVGTTKHCIIVGISNLAADTAVDGLIQTTEARNKALLSPRIAIAQTAVNVFTFPLLIAATAYACHKINKYINRPAVPSAAAVAARVAHEQHLNQAAGL